MTLNELADRAHQTASSHGFWDNTNLPTKLALIHSEVSEALEELRVTKDPANPGDAFSEELADVLIRVFDLAGRLGIDLDKVVAFKMDRNEERSIRHGKNF